MPFEELDKISGWAYLYGFSYALLVGELLIPLVTERMYDLVDPKFKEKFKHTWQPTLIGLIERLV